MRCTQRALAGCCGTTRSTFMDPQKKKRKKERRKERLKKKGI
jgi:hypothetical protein